jgi:hypothetical protein
MSDTQDEQSFDEASRSDEGGLFSDLIAFMSENKKWWLIPILAVLGVLGVLIVFGGTGALPFLYSFF